MTDWHCIGHANGARCDAASRNHCVQPERDRAVAVATDERLATLYDEAFDVSIDLRRVLDSVHRMAGDEQRPRYRGPWQMDDAEAVDALRARLSQPYVAPTYAERTPDTAVGMTAVIDRGTGIPPWETRNAEQALERIETLEARQRAIAAEESDLERVYEDAGRWSRFFLVDASNGHIHRSLHCSTCFPTTRYAWLPDLSGLTEDDAVKAHGPRLCSVCYPSAPVEWTLGLPKAPKCEGSGKPAAPGYARYRSQPCSVCGRSYPVSDRTGLIRAHKPKETK